MSEFRCAQDGSVCGLSCGHPHCWRVLRNCNRSQTWSSESGGSRMSIEDVGLPTVKIFNMLDDYGESNNDLYPSKFGGRASHHRDDSEYGTRLQGLQNRRRALRGGLSRSADGCLQSVTRRPEPRRADARPTLRSVEIQEVFDIKELSDYWDETFVARPVYVWVPGGGKSRERRKKKDATDGGLNLNKVSKGPELLVVKNLTDELIPEPCAPPSAQQHDSPQSSAPPTEMARMKDIPYKVPVPTGGQPYPNVGQAPHDKRQLLVGELRSLPKDFLVEIMEKAKNLTDTDELIGLVEKYASLMPRSRQDFLLAIGDVLQQKKLGPAEAVWLSSLPPQQAAPGKAYHLDVDEVGSSPPRHGLRHSSRLSHYDPLPGISGYGRPPRARRIYTNVGTARHTARPFKYDSSSIDFSLGPIFTPPRSRYERTILSERSSVTDYGNDRSDAVADSESERDCGVSRGIEPRDYPSEAVGHVWSGSSSGRPPPKPPAGTPHTPFAARTGLAPNEASASAAEHLTEVDAAAVASAALGGTRVDAAATEDPAAAYKRHWSLRSDYWDDVRRHALLGAIEEGDERGHETSRAEKSLPGAAAATAASVLANDLLIRTSLPGARGSPTLPRPSSRKTSAKSLADSMSLKGAEELPSSAFRPATSATRTGSTPENPRSAASNWPQVDEEALLRLPSAGTSPPRSSDAHRSTHHVHVPTVEFEPEVGTRTATPTSTVPLVHETPDMGDYKEIVPPPMPPPPSPEAMDRPVSSVQPEPQLPLESRFERDSLVGRPLVGDDSISSSAQVTEPASIELSEGLNGFDEPPLNQDSRDSMEAHVATARATQDTAAIGEALNLSKD